MESGKHTVMKLICPINNCKWQYESIFGPEGSLKIILIHAEKDHIPQQVQPSATTVQSHRPATYNMDVAADKGRTNLSKGLARTHLMKMKQGKHESIHTFADKVRQRAKKCEFITQSKCRCGEVQVVDYTDKVVVDVVMAGIANAEIRSTILQTNRIEERTLDDLTVMISQEGASRKASSSADLKPGASLKRHCRLSSGTSSSRGLNISPEIPCPKCSMPFREYNGRNTKGFKHCIACFRFSKQR